MADIVMFLVGKKRKVGLKLQNNLVPIKSENMLG